MKKVLLRITALVMVLTTMAVTGVLAERDIKVYVNWTEVQFDVAPQIIDGRTMVPIRAIFESMGADVFWDGEAGSVTAVKEGTTVIMTVGDYNMYVNYQAVKMDAAPAVIDGRVLAPARYVAEGFGMDVLWSSEYNSVIITSPVNAVQEDKVTLYAPDGRMLEVWESEADAYVSVGWCRNIEDVKQTLYSPGGEEITVYKGQVPEYVSLGWYRTKTEAENANKPVSSTSSVTDENSGKTGKVYRTPTGKRYHFDPDCGGKNSYETTLQKAKNAGLTPCAKCAD